METGIDALAVCIGNVHGKYPESGPKLKLDLLKVNYNLVLSLRHSLFFFWITNFLNVELKYLHHSNFN